MQTQLSALDALRLLARMPGTQLFLLALAAITWLVGGNLVVARHYRRVGRSVWAGFKPGALPFRQFDAREWFSILILATVALTLAAVGLSVGPQ